MTAPKPWPAAAVAGSVLAAAGLLWWGTHAPGAVPGSDASSDVALDEPSDAAPEAADAATDDCIRDVPLRSTLKVDGTVILYDGTVRRMTDFPCTGKKQVPLYPSGQFNYSLTLLDPYTSAANQAAAFDASTFIWSPIADAGYAFFTQVTWSTVVPTAPLTNTSASIFGGVNFLMGDTIIQPVLITDSPPPGQWSILYAYCCNPILEVAGPNVALGDNVSFEAVIDNRYPCPANGLGCTWVMGALDTQDAAPGPMVNFGENWISVQVPANVGPGFNFEYAIELNLGGTTCNDTPGGPDASVTFVTQTMYEHDTHSDAGNIVVGSTLPITPNLPAASFQVVSSNTTTGRGWQVQSGLELAGGNPLVFDMLPGSSLAAGPFCGDASPLCICGGAQAGYVTTLSH